MPIEPGNGSRYEAEKDRNDKEEKGWSRMEICENHRDECTEEWEIDTDLPISSILLSHNREICLGMSIDDMSHPENREDDRNDIPTVDRYREGITDISSEEIGWEGKEREEDEKEDIHNHEVTADVLRKDRDEVVVWEPISREGGADERIGKKCRQTCMEALDEWGMCSTLGDLQIDDEESEDDREDGIREVFEARFIHGIED